MNGQYLCSQVYKLNLFIYAIYLKSNYNACVYGTSCQVTNVINNHIFIPQKSNFKNDIANQTRHFFLNSF